MPTRLTESYLRKIIREEANKIVSEQEGNNFNSSFTQAVKQMAGLYDQANQNPNIGMDLGKVEREFINKFKSSDQADPAAYVIGAAKAWLSLYASDVDRK
jgi:hypothetical protein